MTKTFSTQSKTIFITTGLFLFLSLYFVMRNNAIHNGNHMFMMQPSQPHMAADTKLGSSPTMSMDNQMKKMDAAMRFTASAIVLTNNEVTDWQLCRLELNATITKKGFMYTEKSLPGNTQVTIPLANFTRDSKAFDTTKRNADNVMIMCESTNGMRGWNYFTNR